MDLEHKRRLYAVVRHLIELPDTEREAQIVSECAGDLALEAEIRTMLGSTASDMLDRPAAEIAERLAMSSSDEQLPIGSTVGGWQIVRALGQGGMGTVYLAERRGDGYVQTGALKLIKRGMDSNEVLARFRQERHILSRLNQPNIARLLDGGIANDGRPFLIMEYVDGESISTWAERTQAGLSARITLFLQICDAVAHAHRHLIVHRDIKPGNVLVDPDGTPKLLDFGIAKVVGHSEADSRTQTAARFLSPAYAAPEQKNPGGVISTSTDIYQLGVLLFELLSGTRYHELADANSRRPTSLLANAREKAGDHGPATIQAKSLRGDPGIIVARAVNEEPARRYATVEALADDLRRWRDGKPILARADSSAYRFRRFVSRHRLATALGMIALLGVLLGSVLALWQAQRAEREARLARSAQAFLTSVFEQSAPDAAAGARVTARELLDRGAARIRDELGDQAQLRSEMLLTLGGLYRQLGQFEQAADLLGDALRIASANGDQDMLWRTTLELGVVERQRQDSAKARLHLDAVINAPVSAEMRSRAHAERALLLEWQGDYSSALEDARAAGTIDLQRGEQGRGDDARDRHIEALILTRLGQFEDADKAFTEAISIASGIYGSNDTRVAQIQNDYAVYLLSKSRPAEGEALTRKTLESRRLRLGEKHPHVAESLQLLGGALRQQGRLDEAQSALEEALAIQRETLGNTHGDVANTLNSLSILASSRQQYATAERYVREALEIQGALGQAETASSATMATTLGVALMRMGRYEEAGQLLNRALVIHHAILGDHHPAVLNSENALAQLELRRGNTLPALEHSRKAVAIADEALGPSREAALVRATLAIGLLRNAQADLALEQAQAAAKMLEAIGAAADPRATQISVIEADALLALGRVDKARALAEKVFISRSARQTTDVSGMLGAHALLCRVERASGNPDEAKRHHAAAIALLASIVDPDPELARDIARH